jgi:hypothetical protein
MPITSYANVQSSLTSSPLIIFNWFVKKAILKKKYPFLHDKDLQYEVGKETEMYENLQIKLDLSREELQKIIAEI